MKQIPVIPKRVLYRNAFKIKHNLLKTLEEFAEEYGNIFALNIGKRMVIINEPNFIKQVTLENHLNYIKGDAYNLFHPRYAALNEDERGVIRLVGENTNKGR